MGHCPSQAKACKAEAQPASWRQRESYRSGVRTVIATRIMHRGRTAESESAAVPSKEAAQLATGAKGPALADWRGKHVRFNAVKKWESVETTYGGSGAANGGTLGASLGLESTTCQMSVTKNGNERGDDIRGKRYCNIQGG